MEVMVRRSPDFQFDTVVTSPYTTAPSSPRFIGEPFDERFHYTSVPTSPTRASAIFSHFSDETGGGDLLDFAFDYARQPGSVKLPEISTADELFEKGRIRLLQPPPPARSSHPGGERGRQRASPVAGSGSKSRARESRSLSPLRNHSLFAKADSSTAGVKDSCGSRKWRLKDLLLFRSASEGRATGRSSKDPLQKYTLFSANKKKGGEDSRNGSFRSTESSGGSVRRAGQSAASAHEIHYTANRAAAEVQRKKTPLAYQRQGLFSCLQFNPAIRSITKGFISDSSFPRGRP